MDSSGFQDTPYVACNTPRNHQVLELQAAQAVAAPAAVSTTAMPAVLATHAPTPMQPPQMAQLQVSVPTGVEPGQEIAFMPPGYTQSMTVTSPQRLPPGSTLTVQYPMMTQAVAAAAVPQLAPQMAPLMAPQLPQPTVQLEQDNQSMKTFWGMYACGCCLGFVCNPLCGLLLWTVGTCMFFCKPAADRARLPQTRIAGLVTATTLALACSCMCLSGAVWVAMCASGSVNCGMMVNGKPLGQWGHPSNGFRRHHTNGVHRQQPWTPGGFPVLQTTAMEPGFKWTSNVDNEWSSNMITTTMSGLTDMDDDNDDATIDEMASGLDDLNGVDGMAETFTRYAKAAKAKAPGLDGQGGGMIFTTVLPDYNSDIMA